MIAFIQEKEQGAFPVTYRLLPGYAGMVLYIGIVFDNKKLNYELNLEWISLGLDPYGDTLQESYIYKFPDLEKLIAYLHRTYHIEAKDIPEKYEFAPGLFPDPVKNEVQKPLCKAAWEQFQKDFKSAIFLDPSLELVYSSQT